MLHFLSLFSACQGAHRLRISVYQSIFWLLLISFCTVSHAIGDFTFDIHKTAKPESSPVYVWNGHLTFTSPVSDGELMGLSQAAYAKMLNDCASDAQNFCSPKKMPNAVISFAVGNEVIISSSFRNRLRGGSFIPNFGRDDNPAKAVLSLCQAEFGIGDDAGTHRTNAHCGEPIALYTYYERYTGESRDCYIDSDAIY